MAHEIDILTEELRQVQELTKTTTPTFPTQFQFPNIELPQITPAYLTNTTCSYLCSSSTCSSNRC